MGGWGEEQAKGQAAGTTESQVTEYSTLQPPRALQAFPASPETAKVAREVLRGDMTQVEEEEEVRGGTQNKEDLGGQGHLQVKSGIVVTGREIGGIAHERTLPDRPLAAECLAPTCARL